MSKEYAQIDESIERWIARQQMFFVATAPLAGDGHVNCSPKGLDTLRVLGPRQLAYVDLGGSGIETVAHVRENGRIVIMLCAFEGPPKIFRFYGRGSVVEPHDPGFDEIVGRFPPQTSVRNAVLVDVERIIDSCGYGVPMYEFRRHRDSMDNWVKARTAEDIDAYRRDKNAHSLDGLPGLSWPD